MRRFLTLLALCCFTVGLVAAAPRKPAPKAPVATPTPPPQPNLNLSALSPTVIVYPFDTGGEVSPKVGLQVAQIFAHTFESAGNVNVLPVPTNVDRTKYLTNAVTKKADYYVAGYVTPIGQSVSVVVQVVGVQSGVILYSQTQQVFGINDASSLALDSHDAIVQLSGTQVDVSTEESASPAPEPEATHGAQFNLTHLFAHHTVVTPRPTPIPGAKPQRAVILVAVAGSSSGTSSADLSRATALLNGDLSKHFIVRYGGAAPADLSSAADSICGTNRDNTIAAGTLEQQHLGGFRPRTRTIFTLKIWTCFGDVLYTTTDADDDIAKAISTTVTDYAATHPANS